ncbi:MAG: tetratricopeptide repeat protein [Thermoleophilia bacterium]|nr:tetratricopeptide repeat protein [Thermoleophilia bacterium]
MRQLPTGTVTFLFTDIEASTRLLRELGDRYYELLERHHRVLREAIGAAGGLEVSTHGDAFFAVFTDPDDAIRAAAAAQRALDEQDWPNGRKPRVRMGLHTGEGVVGVDDYVGLAVHAAARIAGAAHGNQVVLTRATRDAAARDPDVVELGHHVLKNLEEPVELFQLVVDGLPREFPPLKTLTNANLPLPPTPFVGRTRELRLVRDLLLRDDVRLVTLTGPGGTGKTRLALEVTRELVEKFPNGVSYAALATLTDPALVEPAAADALGVEESGRSLAQALDDYLADRQLLLVLDNFEHVMPAAPAVARLLAKAPGLKVLVTSRERLHLSGEREYSVPPLPPAEAVALFTERARAALPTFEDDELERAAIEEICRRLDRLPLAIELAAARVKLLSPRALEGRLGRRLQLLTGGARDLPERQQTLRATIDWSYELLITAERRLLARLAVFPAGCTLEAAEQVCDASLDELASLVDKSLLGRDVDRDDVRFTLLETIRDYALERLREQGELEELRARHARYFVRFAEGVQGDLRGAGQARALRALESEHPNLRAALDFLHGGGAKELELRLVGALWFFWVVRGHLTEGLAQLERALEGSTGQPPTLQADALKAAAALAQRRGDTARAKRFATESVGLYRALGDPGGVSSALTTLAGAALVEGDGSRARQLYEEALALTRDLDDPFRLASALGNLGYMLLMEGDDERAASLFEEGLVVFRRLSNDEGVARSLLNLGFSAWQRGSLVEASAMMKESLRRFSRIGSREGIAYALEGLAAVAAARLESARASRLLGAAEAVCERIELTLDPFEQAVHGRTVAQARAHLGDEAYRAAVEEGRGLSPEEAAEYALRETEQAVAHA